MVVVFLGGVCLLPETVVCHIFFAAQVRACAKNGPTCMGTGFKAHAAFYQGQVLTLCMLIYSAVFLLYLDSCVQ